MLPKPFAYIALVLSVYIIVICSQTLIRINDVEKAQETSRNAYELEEEKNRQLLKTISIQNTDDYLESLSRERLGLVKPGEVVYKIVMKE